MRDRKIGQYLLRYGIAQGRALVASSLEGIDQTVVIPSLAEKNSLFRTLASLALNPAEDLRCALVVCVVNNHRQPFATEVQIFDNQETLRMLKSLIFGRREEVTRHGQAIPEMATIAGSDLRLACIDASSAGFEIPDRDGGVGTARKIGMDAALGILDAAGKSTGSICCLDADTLVEWNYLCAIRSHFNGTGHPAAVTAYAHQRISDPQLQAAICCYEIFLRSYVLGLTYAESPYAYHTIGSTMACTAEGYRSVRGMNRRKAAEDFHFLNKLAKIGEIGVIEETTVFPSPRISERVPFGTGQRMQRFMSGQVEEYRIHNPGAFEILREWLALMRQRPDTETGVLLSEAKRIHVCLEAYLLQCRFDTAWRLIQNNCNDRVQLQRQFHVWFDGLKTLRLIHHLGRTALPPVPMFTGMKDLLGRMGSECTGFPHANETSGIEVQLRFVETLRSAYPRS
jgi:hypothetical protein